MVDRGQRGRVTGSGRTSMLLFGVLALLAGFLGTKWLTDLRDSPVEPQGAQAPASRSEPAVVIHEDLQPIEVNPELPGGAWFADLDQAAAKARAEKLNLLVAFTGSDWCAWCKKLSAEVLDVDSFVSAARKKYVLVSLDFPSGAAARKKVPNPARNEELRKQYGVQGFPTVLVVTPDGSVLAKTGYQPGGAKAWLASLDASLAAKGHAR